MPHKVNPTALLATVAAAKRNATTVALKTVGEYDADISPTQGKKYPSKPFYLNVHDIGVMAYYT